MSWRFALTGRPRLSSALRIRYWTVFLCSISCSADPSIIATGATSLNATARGGGEPAASATAWAAMACWWVSRNPDVPLAALPNAKWMSLSTPAVLACAASNVSRIPSGSQAHAVESSHGGNSGSP